MLWIVRIKDIEIPVRAQSEAALLGQLENLLDLPLESLDYQVQRLPDLAEMLASSAIRLPGLDGHS